MVSMELNDHLLLNVQIQAIKKKKKKTKESTRFSIFNLTEERGTVFCR